MEKPCRMPMLPQNKALQIDFSMTRQFLSNYL
nr:MAG TPA: hypothetical protein [Caudoviricetes sp.]DAO80918.1 MAG TPA: hypothetical protein [Caudoviricetes sp.]